MGGISGWVVGVSAVCTVPLLEEDLDAVVLDCLPPDFAAIDEEAGAIICLWLMLPIKLRYDGAEADARAAESAGF